MVSPCGEYLGKHNYGELMATIQKRLTSLGAVRYRAQIRIKGKPAVSATFRRRSDATRWVLQTEAEVVSGRYLSESETSDYTFSDALNRYHASILPLKSAGQRQRQETQLAWWRAWIGNQRLDLITPAQIAAGRDELLKSRSAGTCARYLAALSHLLTIAHTEWEWIDANPVRRVRRPTEPRGRVRYLSDHERVALLSACERSPHPFLASITVLALSTGMRLGEIRTLEWGDVDFAKKRVILRHTKNGEDRAVPLPPRALEALLTHKRQIQTVDGLIFPSSRNPQVPACIRKAWNNAIRESGIVDFRFHDLRHTCASYLAMSGASLMEIAEILGHKSFAMVRRYAHLSEAHTARVVERMNQQYLDQSN